MTVDITSHSNPRVKFLKSLQKSRNRKKEGLYLMEGRPELDIAIQTGHVPKEVFYCEEYIDEKTVANIIAQKEVNLVRLSKSVFEDLTYQHVPGNFIGLFESWQLEIASLSQDDFTLVLENVEKPGNLGAILRTCDALGVKQVVCTETQLDLHNPNVLRNSRGAIFKVMVVFANNEDTHQFLRSNNMRIYAAALTDMAKNFKSVGMSAKSALVFGAESKGLSDFWLSESDEHLIIPMLGVVDSLNVSVSAAIMMSNYFC